MVDYAPGMRTIIRDEEWMVKKVEKNNMGNNALYCVGILLNCPIHSKAFSAFSCSVMPCACFMSSMSLSKRS